MNLPLLEIWELIDSFKEQCSFRGWETCKKEDWVKTEDGVYHNFLWLQTIHPSTFEKIALNHKCGIYRGLYYEVVNIAYMAWLFKESPPEFILSNVKKNSELSEKTAIFDLSCAYHGGNICRKINETDSMVFKEFEKFLKDECSFELKSVDEIPTLTT